MALPAGERIGEWVILRRLGVGGFGEVYLCHRRGRPDERRAVKVIREPTGYAWRSLLREAAKLEAIRHPNIVAFESFAADSSHLVMEFVDGESLQGRVSRGRLPVPEALAFLSQIAAALHALHERGLVHRDVKPPNIVIRVRTAKLVDFGLALDPGEERISSAAGLRGSLYYAPIDQLLGKRPDPTWDIYALGVTFFEALTGARGFYVRAGSPEERQEKVVELKDSTELLDPGPDFDPPLRSLISAMTDRSSARRPDAYRVLRMVEGILEGDRFEWSQPALNTWGGSPAEADSSAAPEAGPPSVSTLRRGPA